MGEGGISFSLFYSFHFIKLLYVYVYVYIYIYIYIYINTDGHIHTYIYGNSIRSIRQPCIWRHSFLRAWLAHSSREISQIAGGSDPLRWLNFKICESEPYINNVILRIPLYKKILMVLVPGWRLSVRRHETLSTK